MSSGRLGGSLPFSRAPPTRDKLRNVFIVCEGASELDYFQALRDRNMYRDCVIVSPVDKFGPDVDDSDRLSLIQLADEYRQFQRNGTMRQRLFVSRTIQAFIDNFKGKYYSEFNRSLKDLRAFLRDNVRDDPFFNAFTLSEYTSKEGLVEDDCGLAKAIIKKCSEVLGKGDDYFDLEDSIAFPESVRDPSCQCFVVFDRDYDARYSRGDEDYDEWISECLDKNIDPVISSPCFELWLYMHWPNNNYGMPSFGPEYAHEIKVKIIQSENPE